MSVAAAGYAFAAGEGDSPAALTADEIARRMDERETGQDGQLNLEMTLTDHRGRNTARSLIMLTRREDGLDKQLLRFLYPSDIRDTGFLALETEGREDDHFLYLPAVGRSRRISARERQDSFVGSDLTYEDIAGRRLADYTYVRLGEKDMDDRPCYILESVAKRDRAKYPRIVSWVDSELFLVRKAEIYGRSGEKVKDYRAESIEEIDGIWTVMGMTMADRKHETRTRLRVTSARYNQGVPEAVFTRRILEQGGESRLAPNDPGLSVPHNLHDCP